MSSRNTAYGLPIEHLSVVVVEQSKPMQNIIRSVLTSIKVNRVRVYESAQEAMRGMYAERPHVVLTDLALKPTSGIELIRLMRRTDMAPLCFVPIIPAMVLKGLRWVTGDDREMEAKGERFVINGYEEVLSALNYGYGGRQGGGHNDVSFRPIGGNSTGGDSDLKFHREAANEGLDEGLKFHRKDEISGETEIAEDALELDGEDTAEEGMSAAKLEEARKRREHSGFAPLSR